MMKVFCNLNAKRIVTIAWPLLLSLLLAACSEEPGGGPGNCLGCDPGQSDLIEADYDPQPYSLDIPEWLPKPIIPEDNPMTEEGVALGRRLFYDPILSVDSSMSCASCHKPELAFTDGRAFSKGVRGVEGRRNAMSLVNLVFNPNEFFWDGSSGSLEHQVLIPVEDPVELNDSWEHVIEKLRRHDAYPELFREAFGVRLRTEIQRRHVQKAIAQFERTLISGNSRFDRVVWKNEDWFTDAEQRGKLLFFLEESQKLEHPGCSHCHFDPLFTDNRYKNNGLDSVDHLNDFNDLGRGEVTGRTFDNGRFRVPTLRNIELTAPYMHDGRFETLEEVLDHYSKGGHGVENEDPNIRPFSLSEREKQDLIAFLKTLTDTSFIQNPAFRNPFD